VKLSNCRIVESANSGRAAARPAVLGSTASTRSAEEKLAFKKRLEARTLAFGIETLRYLDSLPNCNSTRIVSFQLGKSATSVGANYREANRGESEVDFAHKLGIVLKECAESHYWLEILEGLRPQDASLDSLTGECIELLKVFQSASRHIKENKGDRPQGGTSAIR